MSNVATKPPCTCGADPEARRLGVTVRTHADGCAALGDRPARLEPPSGAFAVDAVREAIADRAETYDRARTVRSILERCEQELLALQCIAHLTAGDVNELGAAKGFTERAILALGRMPL